MPPKRDWKGGYKPRGGGGGGGIAHRQGGPKPPVVRNAYTPMFEHLRDELDKHYDRKERIVKASRDVTALSKKIVRMLDGNFPEDVEAAIKDRLATISEMMAGIAPEVQGINRYRYGRQLMCIEELIEALTFEHYLRHQRLMHYEEAVDAISKLSVVSSTALDPIAAPDASTGEAAKEEKAAVGKTETGTKTETEVDDDASSPMEGVETTTADTSSAEQAKETEKEKKPEAVILEPTMDDYLMGVFDLSGEVMRFAITSAALTGELASSSPAYPPDPSKTTSAASEEDEDDGNTPTPRQPRTVLADIQELGTLFEMLPQRKGKYYQIKLATLRTSVLKVEKMGYGLRVRGSERPKGWMPDTEVEAEGGHGEEE